MQVKVKRKLIILLIFTLSIAAMIGLTNMRPEPEKKPLQNKAILVEVLDLQSSEVNFDVTSQGTVKPRTVTVLSAEVSGRIIDVSNNFIAGGVFKKGDVLMKIDPTDYLVAVDQAAALLEQRQIEYDGAQSLRSKGYRAEAELAAAKSLLAAANAALVKAKRNLARTNIQLPYDGMVKSKSADIGQYVNPGILIGTTFAVNTAEIRLALTDQDLAFIELPVFGNIATLSSDTAPTVTLSAIRKGQYQEWKARIVRTEGVVDEKSRVTYAVAQIEDPYRLQEDKSIYLNKNPLPIGTFVKAAIQGRSYSNIIKVPRTAIRGKNELMLIDSENRLNIREVNILRADSEFAYIQQGVVQGDRISITAVESPINGMKVRTADEISDDTTTDQSQLAQD